ncbi:hypothetical protein H4R35_006662 [Dimargaris xerosporica]|nr:hypothetical protein H4R35_006662 [Dimargaris xerosporica]
MALVEHLHQLQLHLVGQTESYRPLFEAANLAKLADHWPVLAFGFLGCTLVYYASALLSPLVFRQTFRKLRPFQQVNWHIHVVSLAHCLLALYLSIPLINHPSLIYDMIEGYWYYYANIAAISCGYFLWDSIVSLRYIRETGIGFAIHGLSALGVFLLSFRPFITPYGPVFIMFELSTPFLNIHWFMDKLGLTGSVFQLVNGVFLLASFFLARLVFGIYWAGHLAVTFYNEWDRVPTYLAIFILVANTALNILNIFWFYKMVAAVRSRFTAPAAKKTE